MEYLGNIMKHKIAVCGFDFCGCGNAEGDVLSMGYYEQHDIRIVVDHVLKKFPINQISLWGRSLGAVSSLLYIGINAEVKSVVLDSPFKHLKNHI